ncbi:MAG: hypothetical protein ACTIKR_06960 [Advenella sp.]|uniref:MxaK protein n=1 Tax=Advenella kashmirensis TaxID=310575 RepID=A0A356LEM6_9BURK|nr:hypothetical protein [Advenella sp. FME57]HBP29436.1 hypothetical protein [Advenella kashmirensis]
MVDTSRSGKERKRASSHPKYFGELYTWVLWLGLTAAIAGMITALVFLHRTQAENAVIGQLENRNDIAVSEQAAPEVSFARLRFLTAIGRLDDALPWVELLAGRAVHADGSAASPKDRLIAAQALYNMGNARLRFAIALLGSSKTEEAPSSVRLAKEYYIRALRLDPSFWNARYNLDIASRLVRDLPEGQISDEEESPETPKRLWTDLPGLPKGLP